MVITQVVLYLVPSPLELTKKTNFFRIIFNPRQNGPLRPEIATMNASPADRRAPLNLPASIHAQAVKLLIAIEQARSVGDTVRAADRAEGVGLGIETVRALNPSSLEGLYLAFDSASQSRQAQLS